MGGSIQKKNRMLEIFYRAMRGEDLSVKKLAAEYEVSAKSIARDISEIKNFLCDNRELVQGNELKYVASSKTYYLEMDDFLLSKELMAIMKVLAGCRAFSKEDMLTIVSKLKGFTTQHDKSLVENRMKKEMYHYNEVKHDCKSVIDHIWKLTRCMDEKIEITVAYNKMNGVLVKRRMMPIALIFSEYYFYLIAYLCDKDDWKPLYYRIDRITDIVEHRTHFRLDQEHDFDEGELRSKIQFMFSGEYRKIKFSYTGPSVQAILDKLPTAKVIDVEGKTQIIEAETYGTGINMFLLSQGRMVKALAPQEFVDEMRMQIEDMRKMYE